MAQKGQKNHYNIKFLKGYGFSISVKNSKIVLKNIPDPFAEPEIEEWFANKMPYEKIVMSGKGYVSTEALELLSKYNRNLILLDTYGNATTFLNPAVESITNSKYRIGQYDTFRDPDKQQYLSKQIVKAKINSQINFLQSTNKPELREGISQLEDLRSKMGDSVPINTEKNSATIYFREFRKLIPERHGFTARNNVALGSSKKNATDVINALLNYGYTVLAGEISKFINGVGLDAYYGFYHQNQSGFQILVYDMIEPFRWLVDYSVWRIAQSDVKGYRINLKDYARTREGVVVMDYSLVRRFLELLERAFRKERRFEFSHGKKTSDGLKSVQEITISKIAVTNLADFCIGKRTSFEI